MLYWKYQPKEGGTIMPRKKKDGRFINYYIDRTIYERLERYAEDKSQQMTTALERILDEHLTRYEAEQSSVERYCPNCHILVRSTRCPRCDKRWLEEPGYNDYCFLTDREVIWAGVFEDCLRLNGIPYLTENTIGAGLAAKIGTTVGSVRFYVRYGYFHRAQALEEELFSAEAEIGEEDAE